MTALASVATAIVITAPWGNGGTIPRRYTCDGGNARPRVTWTWPGHTAAAFAVEAVDVDAPGGHFVHWLQLRGVTGTNTFGLVGWSGPCPPVGDAPHRYVLTVYALDRAPRLARGFGERAFRRALRGHVLARATLVGRYARP